MTPPSLWSVMEQPASHNGAAPTRDLSIPLKMWASVAVGGISGSGNVAVCVDCKTLPLATWTLIGEIAGQTLVRTGR